MDAKQLYQFSVQEEKPFFAFCKNLLKSQEDADAVRTNFVSLLFILIFLYH